MTFSSLLLSVRAEPEWVLKYSFCLSLIRTTASKNSLGFNQCQFFGFARIPITVFVEKDTTTVFPQLVVFADAYYFKRTECETAHVCEHNSVADFYVPVGLLNVCKPFNERRVLTALYPFSCCSTACCQSSSSSPKGGRSSQSK